MKRSTKLLESTQIVWWKKRFAILSSVNATTNLLRGLCTP